jgi:hypothetical protein
VRRLGTQPPECISGSAAVAANVNGLDVGLVDVDKGLSIRQERDKAIAGGFNGERQAAAWQLPAVHTRMGVEPLATTICSSSG